MIDAVAEAIVEIRREWQQCIAPVENENRALKAMLGDLVNKFNDRAAKLQTELNELKQLERARTSREQALAETRDYVAEVTRQAADVHIQLENQRLETALAARDARIERLELQLRMLCEFLSVSGDYKLPKGL
jgi:hypothetical protein